MSRKSLLHHQSLKRQNLHQHTFHRIIPKVYPMGDSGGDRMISEQSLPQKEIGGTQDSRSGRNSLVPPSSFVVPDRTAEASTQDRPSDPLGLSLMYEPKDLPSIDSIFVHGPSGTSRQTWSRDIKVRKRLQTVSHYWCTISLDRLVQFSLGQLAYRAVWFRRSTPRFALTVYRYLDV